MSKYTTEVRYICEQAYNDAKRTDDSLPDISLASISEIVKKGIGKIFDNEDRFPIYDETHREELCKKILMHYYTREICAETVGLWKLWLNNRMREIMPYYNELYKTVDMDYNPLEDVNYKRSGDKIDVNNGRTNRNDESNTHENGFGEENRNRDSEGHSANSTVSEGSSTKNDVNRFSDTPQNGLSEVRNDRYLTNATLDDSETKENRNVNGIENNKDNVTENNNSKYGKINSGNLKSVEENYNTANGKWIEEVKGKMSQRSYTKLIEEYRSAILNVDTMIIEELKDLFFYLW